MKDIMEFLPWRKWQELAFVGVVLVVVFVVYYGVFFPIVGEIYTRQLVEKKIYLPGEEEVTMLYFPFVASFTSSEAWVTIRHSPIDASASPPVYFIKADEVGEQSGEHPQTLIRWGCDLSEGNWFCTAQMPRLELSHSRLDTYEVRYTLFPLQTPWGKSVAKFALISRDNTLVTRGEWPLLYYDPWRVFWWQVVYKNLLFPPWSNMALVLGALLAAFLWTEHAVGRLRENMQCLKKPSEITRSWWWWWRLVVKEAFECTRGVVQVRGKCLAQRIIPLSVAPVLVFLPLMCFGIKGPCAAYLEGWTGNLLGDALSALIFFVMAGAAWWWLSKELLRNKHLSPDIGESRLPGRGITTVSGDSHDHATALNQIGREGDLNKDDLNKDDLNKDDLNKGKKRLPRSPSGSPSKRKV